MRDLELTSRWVADGGTEFRSWDQADLLDGTSNELDDP